MQILKEKIQSRQAHLGIIGLCYICLPLGVEKAKAGFKTIGFDIQQKIIDCLNQGYNYICDVVNEDLELIIKNGMLKATSDFIASFDYVCICVSTLLDEYRQPDISYVKKSAEKNKGLEKYSKNIYGNGRTSLNNDIIDSIKNKRKPLIDAVAGRNAVEVVLAIYKSSYLGQVVKLPLNYCITTDFSEMF